MRRKAILSLTMIWLILGMVSAAQSRDGATKPLASLQAITTDGQAPAHQLLLRIDGAYSFQTVRATADTVLVDLKGVKAAGVAKDGELAGGVFTGYHILQYTDANGLPVVRVQLSVKHAEPLKIQRESAGLRLEVGQGSPASSAAATPQPAAPRPVLTAAITPSAKPSPRGPVAVSGVSIKTGPAGETFVDIATTHPTAYNVLHLSDPARLVVDFEGARTATAQRVFAAHSDLVKGVRVGQFREANPAVARVVADLAGDPAFDVHAQPGGVRVELKSRTAAKPVAAAPPAEAVPAPVKTEEKLVAVAKAAAAPAVEEKPAELPLAPQKMEVAASESTERVAEKPAQHTALEIQKVLPATSASADVAATPKPESPGESPEAIQAARAALTMVGSSGAVSSAPQGQTKSGGSEQPKYTGEPISLNLKDVDLKDFFRLIHEISGLNIIVDPNVTGNVTMVLDAVPWDQALDIVLKNNRLGKTLEGNVLRIARVETITAEQEAATKLAAAREEAQPLVTVFRPVNYAKATTIATMLKSWVGGGALSKRGNILVDDRTNTLIISDIQTQIPVIESILTRLDKKAKQVQIEARVVVASASFSRNLSSALAASYINKSGSTVTQGASGSNSNSAVVQGASAGTVTAGDVGGFGVFAISNAGARYIINAALAAAESSGQSKTISRPTIVTQNNVPGTVLQGSQIPIQTTINNTISIQYVSATLTLKVTPQVTEDGNVFLDINVQNASPSDVLTSAGPSIKTQQATTQVLVPDGGTVVFGGVSTTLRSKSATYVPLLGNIPVIGHLFKTSKVGDTDDQLLFFVSPKVLPG